MTPKKYLVVYRVPGGTWIAYETDDKHEADAIAANEQSRTGFPHEVVKR